jgi:membrane protease YdiL (CAAX protease family)
MPLFDQLSVAEKAAVSIAAGLGEELLFRGLGQASLAAWIGGDAGLWAGLIVGSLAFGLCHWLSRTYAVLAACMGIYFGLLLVWTGNLWTPILAHATYDFMALVFLTWAENRNEEPPENA